MSHEIIDEDDGDCGRIIGGWYFARGLQQREWQ
jgi:hypothetical protein